MKLAYQVEMAPKLSLAHFFKDNVSWAIVLKHNNLSSRSVSSLFSTSSATSWTRNKKCQEKVKVLQARVQHLETQLDELNSAPWWFSQVEGNLPPGPDMCICWWPLLSSRFIDSLNKAWLFLVGGYFFGRGWAT